MKYLNCDVKIVPPNSFVYHDHHLNENDLAFVVSQSGCSTNSIEALKKLKELGHLAIGLTGNINSDFKDWSDLLIDYSVGKETVGYVTKGVATLAQFLMLFALEAALAKQKISIEDYEKVMKELHEVPTRHETIQKETFDFISVIKLALNINECFLILVVLFKDMVLLAKGPLKLVRLSKFLVLPMKLRNLFMDLIYNSLLTIRFISLMTLLVVVKG